MAGLLGVVLIPIGLVLVVLALATRPWAVVRTTSHGSITGGDVLRIMVGVAGGIVLAMVFLLMVTFALAQ